MSIKFVLYCIVLYCKAAVLGKMHHFLEPKRVTFETFNASPRARAFGILLFTFSGLKMTKFPRIKKPRSFPLHIYFSFINGDATSKWGFSPAISYTGRRKPTAHSPWSVETSDQPPEPASHEHASASPAVECR